MESNNLTTRTYTAPTCTLIVASKEKQVSRLDRRQQSQPIDFILHLDDPDRREIVDCITLQGEPQQLDCLQQVVTKYIAELVAKFPLPSTNDNITSEPTQLEESEVDDASISSQLYPNRETQSTRSGIMNNLPGLRNNLSQSAAESSPNPQPNLPAKPSISLFFLGRLNKHQKPTPDVAESVEGKTPAVANNSSTAPYLTGIDRSIDHHLHLGNLSTVASGEKLTLSAIQLFDLAKVLDEYVAESATIGNQAQPVTLGRASISADLHRPTGSNNTTTPLSRLPNLPKIPTEPEANPVYYQNRNPRPSSFISGVPWAIAAAIAVGMPLLLLDPNPNPIKDLASNVKIPSLDGAKKSVTPAPGAKQTKPDPSSTASVPNPTLPKPWQEQPIQPPQVSTKPLDSGIQPTQNSSTIGLAPLPSSLLGTPGQNFPATAIAGENVQPGLVNKSPSEIAPNPLNASRLPSNPNSIDDITALPTSNPTPIKIAKSNVAGGNQTRAIGAKPVVTGKKTTNPQGQLPIEQIDPGTVSISKRPMSMPPANRSDLPINTPNTQPIPFNPPKIDPLDRQIKRNVKSTAVATKSPLKTFKPNSFEPFTPVPRNPNLINPEENTSTGAEPQNPPFIPNQPLQANNGAGVGADPADLPSLQESKRYFQGKWKANNTQPNSLQYVVQISGKSGTVRSVSPQGDAATNYLQQTKFIKLGQKLISPAAAGNSDQKIRVLLEPDGNVDTFIEP